MRWAHRSCAGQCWKELTTWHTPSTLNDYAAPTAGLFARLRQAFSTYRAYVETRDELEALSDRELADLGISRLSCITDVAHKAANT